MLPRRFCVDRFQRPGVHGRDADVHVRSRLSGRGGEQALEHGLKRVALFTDKTLRSSVHVAAVSASLRTAGVEFVIYDEIAVEPTTASFQAAARFASEVESSTALRLGRRRLGDGHLQGREPVCDASGPTSCPTSTHRSAAGRRFRVRSAAYRLPDDCGDRIGDHGHRDLQPDRDQLQDRHHLPAADPDRGL